VITRVYFEVVDREALSAALDGSPRIERCEGGQREQASGDGDGRTGSRCRSGSFASRGANTRRPRELARKPRREAVHTLLTRTGVVLVAEV